jgi:polyisoprenoid-binding protein YceI
MKYLIICVSILGLSASTLLAQPRWEVTQGRVSFEIKNAGVTVDGHFNEFGGKLKFDPDQLEGASLIASVPVRSIETGMSMRDDHLQDESWFYEARYPRVRMRSVSIEPVGGNRYRGRFELSIKGRTRKVELPFTFVQQGNQGTFDGKFSIDRQDYGVGDESFMLSDEVQVFVEVQARLIGQSGR